MRPGCSRRSMRQGREGRPRRRGRDPGRRPPEPASRSAIDRCTRSRAQSMTLMPFGFVPRIAEAGRAGVRADAQALVDQLGRPARLDRHGERVPRAAGQRHDARVHAAGPTDAAYVSHAPVTIRTSRAAGRARRRSSGRIGPIGVAFGWISGSQPGSMPVSAIRSRRPVAGRDVVRGPGPGVAPVDDRPTAQEQRVELVPVHEPASLGGHRRVGVPPPQRPVDRVHPPRHVTGQAEPLLRGATRRRHGSDVVAPCVGGHQAPARAVCRRPPPETPRGPRS